MERNAARYELGEMEAACPRPTRAPVVVHAEPVCGLENVTRIVSVREFNRAHSTYMIVGGVK